MGEGEVVDEEKDIFQFNYKPRQIKEYLDRFVIKQDEAKKVISVAICDHYNHVRLAFEGKEHPNYTSTPFAFLVMLFILYSFSLFAFSFSINFEIVKTLILSSKSFFSYFFYVVKF